MIAQPSSAYLTSYYVEDENNVGSVKLRGASHSSTTRYKGNGSYITGRGDEVTRYVITQTYSSAYTYSDGAYTPIGTVYKIQSGTYYKGNGTSGYLRGSSVQAIDYDGKLYEDGGTHTYPLYTKVNKTLYEGGSTRTFPAYKAYSGKVYDAGQTVTFNAAEFEIETVTGLTV